MAHATKPCDFVPCRGADETFDEAECNKLADWVATGRITNVKHRRAGYPENKDFATFKFKVTKWHKRSSAVSPELIFTVGWCENPQELPDDTSGLFLFYGSTTPLSTGGNRYLHFRRVPEKSSD
ncbi:MAG: hypothetical protein H7Y89_07870 [Steroidobacteraceae bacterium]|nr:hypothetical protein [Steroidobacteraceae bacterium]